MNDEVLELLRDVLTYVEQIEVFTAEIDQNTYATDVKTRLAVERCFEVIGEALLRIRRRQANELEHVNDADKIIAFRNILAHGYDQISNTIVWSIIKVDLPILRTDIQKILLSAD